MCEGQRKASKWLLAQVIRHVWLVLIVTLNHKGRGSLRKILSRSAWPVGISVSDCLIWWGKIQSSATGISSWNWALDCLRVERVWIHFLSSFACSWDKHCGGVPVALTSLMLMVIWDCECTETHPPLSCFGQSVYHSNRDKTKIDGRYLSFWAILFVLHNPFLKSTIECLRATWEWVTVKCHLSSVYCVKSLQFKRGLMSGRVSGCVGSTGACQCSHSSLICGYVLCWRTLQMKSQTTWKHRTPTPVQ